MGASNPECPLPLCCGPPTCDARREPIAAASFRPKSMAGTGSGSALRPRGAMTLGQAGPHDRVHLVR